MGRSYVSGQTLKKKRISVTSSNQLQCAYFQVNVAKTDQLERLQNREWRDSRGLLPRDGCGEPHTLYKGLDEGLTVAEVQPAYMCMLSRV